MKKYNPYRNIYYYYRGPSNIIKDHVDTQIEDNATKAFINTLENSNSILLESFLKELDINIKNFTPVVYDLQVSKKLSRPDAEILIDNKYTISIESKVDASLDKEQIRNHLDSIVKGYLICITKKDEDIKIIKKFMKM